MGSEMCIRDRIFSAASFQICPTDPSVSSKIIAAGEALIILLSRCLLYTSDAADERSSVDLGGRRIIKKKHSEEHRSVLFTDTTQTTK